MPPLPPAANNKDTSTTLQIPCDVESPLPPPQPSTVSLLTPTKFEPPYRIGYGTIGKEICLRVNHFPLRFAQPNIQHYHVQITSLKDEMVGRRPRAINRALIHHLITTYPTSFQDLLPVYDGKTNLYTRAPLGSSKLRFNLRLPDEVDDQEYQISIEFSREIFLSELSFDASEAIESILRCQGAQIHASIGKSMYTGTLNLEPLDLGHGKELWRGYHQSARRTEWSTVLNIDVTSGAFHQGLPVLHYLLSVLEWPTQMLHHNQSLTDAQRKRFHLEIKNLKIQTTHCEKISKRKFKIRCVTINSAKDQRFTMNLENGVTEQWTVMEYFRWKYSIELQYPHMPCLKVGTDERPTFFPLEVCRIAPGQRCRKPLTDDESSKMINVTNKSAPEREAQIRKIALKTFAWESDPYAQEFGISVDTSMTEVKGRILTAPRIQFGNKIWTQPVQGHWDTRGKNYHTPVTIHTYALVCLADQDTVPPHKIRKFLNDLQKMSKEAGISMAWEPVFIKHEKPERLEDICSFIKKKNPDIQMILIVLPGKNQYYIESKRIGDKVLGIPTQCIQASNICRPTAHLLSNLCLKINMKLGGINSILHPSVRSEIQNEAIIFIGATLVHHPDIHAPSITSLVGTMDAHPSRYTAEVRVQDKWGTVIMDMGEMVKKLLQNFHNATKFKPTRIVLYRDGLLESQHYNALQFELRAIRKACKSIDNSYEPGITMVAVQRKHHTRIFSSTDYCGRHTNVPPGTVVDHGITHPKENDFYLCSHAGIQGTSIPTKYHVLWDDNQLSANDLQAMTYGLCHSYGRCTRAVSLPAPVYYAHLAAVRARNHLVSEDGHGNGGGSQASETSQDMNMAFLRNSIKVHSETAKNMYFI